MFSWEEFPLPPVQVDVGSDDPIVLKHPQIEVVILIVTKSSGASISVLVVSAHDDGFSLDVEVVPTRGPYYSFSQFVIFSS